MDNTWTKVRKNGVEDQILTDVIKNLGKEKFEKLGWEIIASAPEEVIALRTLKVKEEVETTPADVQELKSMKVDNPIGDAPKRKYNKKA